MKDILILGGGLAGLQVAQRLSKLPLSQARVTLIDKNAFHVLKADLYEVATLFPDFITGDCMARLHDSVATPFKSLLNDKVEFFQDEVSKIDLNKKVVHSKKGQAFHYDILVLALGSTANFFNVPGVKKHALPLKTVQDALGINCHVDQLFKNRWEEGNKKDVHICIGGGGATGVELISELRLSLKRLCKKYKFPGQKIHLHLVQGDQTLASFEGTAKRIIQKRFKKLNIKVHLGNRVTAVKADHIQIKNKKGKSKTLKSDITIWTCGVKVSPVIQNTFKGPIAVRPSLESVYHPNVFAAGDNALLVDPKNPELRLPMLGSIAAEQGKFLGMNITRRIKGKALESYCPERDLMMVPLGGKRAVMQWRGLAISGFVPWALRRIWILSYAFSILPPLAAFKKWHRGGRVFVLND